MIKKWMPKIVSSDHEIERDREIKEIRTRIVERLEEEKQNFIFHPFGGKILNLAISIVKEELEG